MIYPMKCKGCGGSNCPNSHCLKEVNESGMSGMRSDSDVDVARAAAARQRLSQDDGSGE